MSRFFMYDAKTGAYAPVAEFAKKKGQGKLPANYRPPEVNVAPSTNMAQNRLVASQSNAKPSGKLPANYRAPKVNTAASTNMAQNRLNTSTYNAKPRSVVPDSYVPPGTGRMGRATKRAKGLASKLGFRAKQGLGLAMSPYGLAAGAGLLGAGALVGGGIALNNRRKEANKSPLQKRYESLRSRLGR